MSDSGSGVDNGVPERPDYVYVGSANVEPEEPRISLPEEIIDAGILEIGEEAWWSWEDTSEILIISNHELQKDYYTSLFSMVVQKRKNILRVPAPMKENPERDIDLTVQQTQVPDGGVVQRGERYHFVYLSDGMAEGKIRSCYLLTDEELSERISAPDDWGANFSSAPEFISF